VRSFARHNSVKGAELAQQTFHQLMEQQNTNLQPDRDSYVCQQCCSTQQQQQADCLAVTPSRKANKQCLLLIITILGHGHSKCCLVKHVMPTAQNGTVLLLGLPLSVHQQRIQQQQQQQQQQQHQAVVSLCHQLQNGIFSHRSKK
jgi:hypothetical protein